MKTEYRIGTIWGIPINIHISLFLLLAYLALRGAMDGFEANGAVGGLISVAFILIFEVLVFTSIALHELGHSFVAIRKGCRVHEITLMFIGGAAKMENMPTRPRDEFLMASAGPAVSVILGTTMIVLSKQIPPASNLLVLVTEMLRYVGIVNLILAGFNLLPAFPMDGGRIFRSLMTPKFGRVKATWLAARVGKAIAILLAVAGIFGMKGVAFLPPANFILVMIAGFVFINADREYRMVQLEDLMQRRGFGMKTPPPPHRETQVLDDHTVLISPPPYEQGPASKAEIHRDSTSNPFRDIFGR